MSAQRLLIATAQALADDEVAVIAITAGVKRDGDEWVPSGVDLTNYNRNPAVFREHNPSWLIGVASLALSSSQIEGRIKFPPPGISAVADEARELAKAGFLTGVSAGVDPTETEPLDPNNPRGGRRVLRCELLEISLVGIGADPDARVIARSVGKLDRAALLRRLPSVPPETFGRFRTMLNCTPEERRLMAAAARHGETLRPSRVALILAEAEQLHRDPVDHYRRSRGFV